MSELWQLTAVEAVALLRAKEVSPTELVQAAIRRIEAVDPAVNALPTRCFERALAHAREIEKTAVSTPDDARGLGGLPVAVKDITDVAGVRSTFGSILFAQRVPQRSDIVVETLEGRGAIVVAKANTPAFASAGGLNTWNELFGATLNPWNTQLACGGSSGGSAVAVATGQVWLATGTDLGGSLRQPAAFCSVVGLRPTPGRVARGPVPLPHDPLCVVGPIARTVADAALALDAMAGAHALDPISLPEPATRFVEAAAGRRCPQRVAFSRDLGLCPVEAEVAAACECAVAQFVHAGARVEADQPDLSAGKEILFTLRPAWLAAHWGDLLDAQRHALDPGFAARLECGLKVPARELWRAEQRRAELARRVVEFFQHYDVLACPTVPVAAFPATTRNITHIGNRALDEENDWMMLTYAISLTGCPAISVPCGFTADGRPVGVQLVCAPRAEAQLLSAAAVLEDIVDLGVRTPIDPRARAEADVMNKAKT